MSLTKEYTISLNCRIDQLTPEHQITIVRLVNHLASLPYEYKQHAMFRILKITEENPYADKIDGLKMRRDLQNMTSPLQSTDPEEQSFQHQQL